MMREIALGVDLGWVSQLEKQGFKWVDNDNKVVDPIQAAKKMGANSVRLRVFVNPPEEALWTKKDGVTCMLGLCDAENVLAMAKRVKDMGMKLMIDFHYSDHFADPYYQDIPAAWKGMDDKQLANQVYQHTKDVLNLLKDNGIVPDWVQVGNEINSGILIPEGDLKQHPQELIHFLNAGYDAVKECCPNCEVITHLAAVLLRDWCEPFLNNFFKNGGKTDVLGFSHYPYWFKSKSNKTELASYLKEYSEKYEKPVMVAEVGGEDIDEEGTYQLIVDTVEAVIELPEGTGRGVFYWEPEVNAEILPDKYPLGAAMYLNEKTLRYSKAISAYKKYNLKETSYEKSSIN